MKSEKSHLPDGILQFWALDPFLHVVSWNFVVLGPVGGQVLPGNNDGNQEFVGGVGTNKAPGHPLALAQNGFHLFRRNQSSLVI